MAAHARNSSQSKASSTPVLQPGTAANEDLLGAAVRTGVSYWPVPVIGVGLFASVLWTLGLVYGAYVLVRWTLS